MHTTPLTAERTIVGARHLVNIKAPDGTIIARIEPDAALDLADQLLEAGVLPQRRRALATVAPLALEA